MRTVIVNADVTPSPFKSPFATVEKLGDELFAALRARSVLEPLTTRQPTIGIDDAYKVSLRFLERRRAELNGGDRVRCGLAAKRMPSAMSPRALSRDRFQPVTVCPAAINRGAINAPMAPRPTNPMFT